MRRALWILAAVLAATPAALDAQERIDRPGPVEHRAAAAAFPERIGEFRRSNVYSYDPAGTNLSATYQLGGPGALLILTIYIYPTAQAEATFGAETAGDRGRLCGSDFEEAREAIRQRNPAAKLTEDGAAPDVNGVPAGLTHRSVYEMVAPFDQQEQEVRSELDLYCYVGGAWQVKYRVTSHPRIDADDALRRFIRSGPWPGRGVPTDPKDIAAATTTALPS
jgi:hypothetical protein